MLHQQQLASQRETNEGTNNTEGFISNSIRVFTEFIHSSVTNNEEQRGTVEREELLVLTWAFELIIFCTENIHIKERSIFINRTKCIQQMP